MPKILIFYTFPCWSAMEEGGGGEHHHGTSLRTVYNIYLSTAPYYVDIVMWKFPSYNGTTSLFLAPPPPPVLPRISWLVIKTIRAFNPTIIIPKAKNNWQYRADIYSEYCTLYIIPYLEKLSVKNSQKILLKTAYEPQLRNLPPFC